ncbi:MAG TPA: arginine--tRNA ligase [Candidatus Binatia bacterium]|nr:arginine--tRNA ligase [Candidatus Binatia bacterium]
MADPQDVLARRIQDAIARAFGPAHAATEPLVRPAQHPRFGDYQANVAMSLGQRLGRPPRDVAAAIARALDVAGVCLPPEIAGPGFINLTLTADFLGAQAAALAADSRCGVEPAVAPVTTVVDYSGPNVAKEMHVGHLRSTVIGDALARTLAFLGHRVIRQNHLGDWGTQFGLLIEHLLDAGEPPGADLDALYRAAQARFEAEPAFAARARERVVALQAGDAATLALWRRLVEQSAERFAAIYARLGASLTPADIRPESFYNPQLAGVVAALEAKGLARPSEGALCVFLDGFTRPDGAPLPLIVRKSDGGYLYATTDLAALRYRVEVLRAERLVYVTDARQAQHFAMVFAAARAAGWLPAGVRAEHVPFGTVLGEDGRPFRTRSGDTVRLADLLDEAERRAAALVAEKNPGLGDIARAEVAHAVGIGAIKYADLASDRVKDYVFSWDRMLAMDGNTAPYLQYAYARIRSIFRKAGGEPGAPPVAIAIAEPAERTLVLKLLQLGGVVRAVAETLEPHRLCAHLYDVATAFSTFYERCPVLQAPDAERRRSRLLLCDLTARTLSCGLGLLGIEALERM